VTSTTKDTTKMIAIRDLSLLLPAQTRNMFTLKSKLKIDLN